MKRYLLSTLLAVVAIGAVAAEGKLRVKIESKAVKADTVTVIVMNDRQNPLTVVREQGTFSVDVELKGVTQLFIMEGGGELRRDGVRYRVPAVPGEEVVITAEDASRYDVGGSAFYQQYHEADLAMESVQNAMSALIGHCEQLLAAGAKQDSVMQVYRDGIEPLEQKMEQTILDFIKTHPDSEASAAIIPLLGTPAKMKEGAALLSAAVQEGRASAFYKEELAQAEARQKAEEESARKQAAGIEAPDFTLNDLNDQPLQLSSLRGKYVVLDFWGSWCGWCIKGFPQMKEYYQKYQGKFEILGIDCNDAPEKWREAVKKHELPWLHVYNPRESTIARDFGITGYPTKIVVGPDGKIVKSIVGESPDFYTLLDELFGK